MPGCANAIVGAATASAAAAKKANALRYIVKPQLRPGMINLAYAIRGAFSSSANEWAMNELSTFACRRVRRTRQSFLFRVSIPCVAWVTAVAVGVSGQGASSMVLRRTVIAWALVLILIPALASPAALAQATKPAANAPAPSAQSSRPAANAPAPAPSAQATKPATNAP